jgi:hypothetical protein
LVGNQGAMQTRSNHQESQVQILAANPQQVWDLCAKVSW